MLLNLLSNAAKFVPPAGGRVDVAAAGARVAGCASRCGTTAAASPPSQQALIFEKFRQGGDAANRPQGTGLGLPISRQIVEHFGGRMWLESGPGPGRLLRLRAAAAPADGAAPTRSVTPREPRA